MTKFDKDKFLTDLKKKLPNSVVSESRIAGEEREYFKRNLNILIERDNQRSPGSGGRIYYW